jgi:MOSC domain-containing protein YiiM
MSGDAALTSICRVLGVFIGGPKTLRDERGEWQSSIARDRMIGPVQLERRGLVGDRATQPYHGTPEIALCLHFMAHYQFWNQHYGLNLISGAVGENLTLDTLDESDICAGDVFRIGTARIQISAPRTPCANQARHIGRPDWVKLTLQELRTGLYARVLAPGSLQAGDELILERRPNPGLTMRALTHCYFHDYQVEMAQRFMQAEGLMDWWKQQLVKRQPEVIQ